MGTITTTGSEDLEANPTSNNPAAVVSRDSDTANRSGSPLGNHHPNAVRLRISVSGGVAGGFQPMTGPETRVSTRLAIACRKAIARQPELCIALNNCTYRCMRPPSKLAVGTNVFASCRRAAPAAPGAIDHRYPRNHDSVAAPTPTAMNPRAFMSVRSGQNGPGLLRSG